MEHCPNNTWTVTLTHGNQCWIKLVNESTVLFLLCACALIAGGTVLHRRWVLGTAGCSANFLVPAVRMSVFDDRLTGRNLTPKAKINWGLKLLEELIEKTATTKQHIYIYALTCIAAVCVKHLRFCLCKIMYSEGRTNLDVAKTHVNKTPFMTVHYVQ